MPNEAHRRLMHSAITTRGGLGSSGKQKGSSRYEILTELKVRLCRWCGQDRDAGDVSEPDDPGFTTNPTLMRKAGVGTMGVRTGSVACIPDRPISLEVLADEFSEMEGQARTIAGGRTTSSSDTDHSHKSVSSAELVRRLSHGIKLM